MNNQTILIYAPPGQFSNMAEQLLYSLNGIFKYDSNFVFPMDGKDETYLNLQMRGIQLQFREVEPLTEGSGYYYVIDIHADDTPEHSNVEHLCNYIRELLHRTTDWRFIFQTDISKYQYFEEYLNKWALPLDSTKKFVFLHPKWSAANIQNDITTFSQTASSFFDTIQSAVRKAGFESDFIVVSDTENRFYIDSEKTDKISLIGKYLDLIKNSPYLRAIHFNCFEKENYCVENWLCFTIVLHSSAGRPVPCLEIRYSKAMLEQEFWLKCERIIKKTERELHLIRTVNDYKDPEFLGVNRRRIEIERNSKEPVCRFNYSLKEPFLNQSSAKALQLGLFQKALTFLHNRNLVKQVRLISPVASTINFDSAKIPDPVNETCDQILFDDYLNEARIILNPRSGFPRSNSQIWFHISSNLDSADKTDRTIYSWIIKDADDKNDGLRNELALYLGLSLDAK